MENLKQRLELLVRKQIGKNRDFEGMSLSEVDRFHTQTSLQDAITRHRCHYKNESDQDVALLAKWALEWINLNQETK